MGITWAKENRSHAGFELYSSVLAAGGATHRVEMRQEF
jgi:hypothetical protein